MAMTVRFTSGALAGKSYPVGMSPVLVGRSSECGIVIPKKHATISKRHIALSADEDGVCLTNLSGRANTTRIGGNVVPPQHRVTVRAGDVVSLGPNGEVAFRIEDGNEATAAGFGFPGKADSPTEPGATATRSPSMTAGTVSPDMRATGFAAPRTTGFAAPRTTGFGAPRATDVRTATSTMLESERKSETFLTRFTDDPQQDPPTGMLATVAVNPDEIRQLLEEARHKIKVRSTLRFAVVIVLLGLAALAYYVMRPVPEASLTWPRLEDGRFAVRKMPVPVPSGAEDARSGFFISVPDDARIVTSVSSNVAGTVVLNVSTYLGARRDVPFFVETSCCRSRSFVTNSCKKLFKEYIGSLENSGSWNFLSTKPLSFLGGDNGIPYFEAQYLRTIQTETTAEQRFGYLLFVAYGDMTIAVSREIPGVEQWRGGILLSKEPLLSVGNAQLEMRWEGREDFRNSPVADLVAEADGYLSRKAPQLLKDVEFLLQSAMIKAVMEGSETTNIKARLQSLRMKERMEFRRLSAEWVKNQRLGDKSACDNTVAEALKIFPDQSDRRHWLLLKGEWR